MTIATGQGIGRVTFLVAPTRVFIAHRGELVGVRVSDPGNAIEWNHGFQWVTIDIFSHGVERHQEWGLHIVQLIWDSLVNEDADVLWEKVIEDRLFVGWRRTPER